MKNSRSVAGALRGRGSARPVDMSEHGDFLDYAERESRRTLEDLKSSFSSHFERCLKVLTLMTAGAGAISAYIVNNWEGLGRPAQLSLLVLAISWSGAAIYLAVHGMRSRKLGAGAVLTALAETYQKNAGAITQAQPEIDAARAMRVVRVAELNREFLQTQAYASTVIEQTFDLRAAVILASLAPAAAMCVWAISKFVSC